MSEDQQPQAVEGETVALAERPVLFPAGPPPTLKEVYWMYTVEELGGDGAE